MLDIHKLLPLSPEYPPLLLQIPTPPQLIYIAGKLPKGKYVAIVGTRDMTAYGKRVTKLFAGELAKKGVVIVSGLARGVDTVAHKVALEKGGKTVAVLGSGIDVIYPPENKKLFDQIIKNGAIVTEYTKGTKPLAKNFLARNRIISGLSSAVLVVEGRQKSGTLSTATHAASQGREVFAIPGPIDSLQSQAPNYLIDNGASVAKSPQDILHYLENMP